MLEFNVQFNDRMIHLKVSFSEDMLCLTILLTSQLILGQILHSHCHSHCHCHSLSLSLSFHLTLFLNLSRLLIAHSLEDFQPKGTFDPPVLVN